MVALSDHINSLDQDNVMGRQCNGKLLGKFMGKYQAIVWIFFVLFMGLSLVGCGEKEKGDADLVTGNWTQLRNRAYILLVISPKGNWESSVRIADATSKIVSSKGAAQGSWHMEEGQLIFTVVESDIEEIWEKNDTSFFEIVELGERLMLLKEESGRVAEWKKTGSQKGKATEEEQARVISMAPYTVNLNKISSNDTDEYLCLKMNLVLNEVMPDQEVPQFHPRARDAAILFLSSLIAADVQDFDLVKLQKDKLVDVINPYMDGVVKDIEIEQVIIVPSIEQVEEFVIEHTMGPETKEEGEEGAEEDKD